MKDQSDSQDKLDKKARWDPSERVDPKDRKVPEDPVDLTDKADLQDHQDQVEILVFKDKLANLELGESQDTLVFVENQEQEVEKDLKDKTEM